MCCGFVKFTTTRRWRLGTERKESRRRPLCRGRARAASVFTCSWPPPLSPATHRNSGFLFPEFVKCGAAVPWTSRNRRSFALLPCNPLSECRDEPKGPNRDHLRRCSPSPPIARPSRTDPCYRPGEFAGQGPGGGGRDRRRDGTAPDRGFQGYSAFLERFSSRPQAVLKWFSNGPTHGAGPSARGGAARHLGPGDPRTPDYGNVRGSSPGWPGWWPRRKDRPGRVAVVDLYGSPVGGPGSGDVHALAAESGDGAGARLTAAGGDPDVVDEELLGEGRR